MTILDHFYEGPEVSDLVGEFAALKLEISTDSARLFEAMIQACKDLEGAPLDARLAQLSEREQASREKFQRRLCQINQELLEFALDSVGLEKRAERIDVQRQHRAGLPRHAAAM